MIRALIVICALLFAALLVQSHRLHGAQLSLARTEAAAAKGRADAQEKARVVEQSSLAVIFDAASMYEKGKTDAQATADRVAADLRSGALRLRHEWSICETGRLSADATATRELAAAVERRNELASAAVRVGAACDAYQRSVIAAWDGVRKAMEN